MVSDVFKKGKTLTSNALFSCRFVASETGILRLSFVAPKTIFKTAVARNNVRRKWYSSLPKDTKRIKHGTYVFILKNESSKTSSEDRIKNLSFLSK